jgi:prevent-host-death family protein
MLPKVNMHKAKTNLSKLVGRVLRSEEVIIARHGEPLVPLTPVDAPAGLRPVGLHRTRLSDAEAMEATRPLDEAELRHWYGLPFPAPDKDDDKDDNEQA